MKFTARTTVPALALDDSGVAAALALAGEGTGRITAASGAIRIAGDWHAEFGSLHRPARPRLLPMLAERRAAFVAAVASALRITR